MDQPKSYRTTAVFGAETDTEDATGIMTAETDSSYVTREMLETALTSFVGPIMQTPPMVSAVRHNGRHLYEMARAGETVERSPRPVTIYSLRLLSFSPGSRAEATMEVDCSKGTYIRTLCADLGKNLGSGGHMGPLLRTAVGCFHHEDAVSIETIERMASENTLAEILRPIDDVLCGMPSLTVSDADAKRLANGVAVLVSEFAPPSTEVGSALRIHTPSNHLLAIGHLEYAQIGELVLKPDKVFAEPC
jgi:tRNA pseudouridine55 synthase